MSVLACLSPSSTVVTLRSTQGHTWHKRTVGKRCVTQESGPNPSVPAQFPTLSPFVQTDSGASQSYLKPCISRWHRWFWPLTGCSAASLPQAQEAGLELYCSFCFLAFLCPVGECSYQSNTFSSNPGFPLASPWAEGNFIVFPNSCTELWCSLALSLAVPPSTTNFLFRVKSLFLARFTLQFTPTHSAWITTGIFLGRVFPYSGTFLENWPVYSCHQYLLRC